MTKSVSRFARNTTDLLEMVRELTAKGTDIFFERENLDTRTMDSEFLLTILASIAEDESHSISSNCRWGLQKRFEDGFYRAASAPYGYDLVDGGYAVNEAEAEIVKEIFRRTLDGEKMIRIAEDLNERGIPTKRNGEIWKGKEKEIRWTGYTIGNILKNVSYTGDQVFQKCYTDRTFRIKVIAGNTRSIITKDTMRRSFPRRILTPSRRSLRAINRRSLRARRRSASFPGSLHAVYAAKS